jgi:peptide/nickel transport system substrate-binding protein
VQLQGLGLEASTRAYPPSVLFGLPEHPSQRPDLMPATFNPDAVNPDTYARIYWFKEAPVNLLGCTSPQGDKLLDKAAEKPTSASAVTLSAQAGEAYRASNCWLGIADVKDTIAASSSLTGFEHELPWVFDVRLSTLHE